MGTADQTAYATTAQPEPPDRLVVHPGDSLWSISRERLGPSASPEQIADEVGRTFELNRERIGDDPNLILAGQELLLSPAVTPVVGEEEPRAVAPPRVYEPSISEEGSTTTPEATLAGDTTHYRVAVQAKSVERALEIVGRQNPGCRSWKRVSGERPALILSVCRHRSTHTFFAPSFYARHGTLAEASV
jgi:hypothetical protein